MEQRKKGPTMNTETRIYAVMPGVSDTYRVLRNDGYSAYVRPVCRADGGKWVSTSSLVLVGVDGACKGGRVPLVK
jgi:hypothetical protein